MTSGRSHQVDGTPDISSAESEEHPCCRLPEPTRWRERTHKVSRRVAPAVSRRSPSSDAYCLGNANTNRLFALPGCSSGVRPFVPPVASEPPVLTATYCRPSTEYAIG